MALFRNPFFKSSDQATEQAYEDGVIALSQGNWYEAHPLLSRAAAGGHISAYYNLALIYAAGHITPYDIDIAADCYYKAAMGGHPQANELLFMLEAADRAGLGTIHLAEFTLRSQDADGLPFMTLLAGCRFYAAVCKASGATSQVIEYELEAASNSTPQYVRDFVTRTGIPYSIYGGGLERVKEGTAADQIIDGLNQLYYSMVKAGFPDEKCLMARCTIVGYLVSKSMYGHRAQPLLGVDRFFGEAPQAGINGRSVR
ncbi:hypothetical protein GKQ23_05895 [Erwinia sp. E602]|uniref:sel1 repeat family protein n=1 Tax=unclassified Erwinia TaxID=2622719 RepID=UPI0007009B39|nr:MULTISPECIES: sel1 repeat family protein [unclassified Erwinia]KQN64753.1 hypothetical protein ASF13_02465 [Erwinia sp. Leaf53]PLV62830.1 hypothetical protein NV64_02940 [Erwinia sp. B116]QUG74566.1 hypothetical protein GKQ23_05895 [Erwinia sp. E602]